MRKDWKSVPLPKLMQDNCRFDSRGLPVPFVVFEDTNGGYHFKINDTYKTIKCMSAGLCTICGTKMADDNKWLVGGIGSAFDERGIYIDHPVHKECAVYALQVCPYLAIKSYTAKTDVSKLQQNIPDAIILQDPTVDPDRLPFFVLLRPSGLNYICSSDYTDIKVKPQVPYKEVEFWNEGNQITDMFIVTAKLVQTKWEKYLKQIIYENCLMQ